jgi:hypothetical protein
VLEHEHPEPEASEHAAVMEVRQPAEPVEQRSQETTNAATALSAYSPAVTSRPVCFDADARTARIAKTSAAQPTKALAPCWTP